MKEQKMMICVIGKWKDDMESNYKLAEDLGEEIARSGAILISGGGTGIMEHACYGAQKVGGITVGFLAATELEGEANNYLDVPIKTGLGYSVRSALAIRSSHFIIMIGGGNGTLGEASMSYLEHKKLIIIRNTGGWADKLESALVDGKYFDERKNIEVSYVDSVKEAVNFCLENQKVV
ncbi:TIGR00725 family protein [Lachnotalea glycerini]|uniref:TIGR00725 family protein n=1 Tax=Lachnotalea glycerini TaxID=1763509 RepID=A0A371JH34_9FIRM|nr:TIGR00725 family protein [Lachnotalea glycerini]RDY32016.1 TIGR00725 family protein [Lachnotalea glycerini]